MTRTSATAPGSQDTYPSSTSATTTKKPQPQSRPTVPHAEPSASQVGGTQYMKMLLALDDIPRLHNMLAAFFTWILLAGFVLFPGTFTSLKNAQGSFPGGQVGQQVLDAVSHVPLFVIAWVCCGIGAGGMIYLWWRWMNNYIWLVNKIFLPGLLNSLAGLISTLANIYGVQHGEYSTTGKVTIIVTGTSSLICGLTTVFYMLWKIRRVKQAHDREVGQSSAGKHGEGLIDGMKRKAGEKGGGRVI
ncbi:hypothetical protein DXG03_005531 [Asterophora parasitica]|uniref:Uncharacterized protein n=1 Tax=Asterophora parasitica TaxID=117018 RepID=A0A9P7GBI8_9AGAR|nr:hypothetical protein DXG03_005531 [Asterophora parasitica]